MVLLSMDRTRYMMRLRKDKNTLLGVDRPIQKDTPLFETLTRSTSPLKPPRRTPSHSTSSLAPQIQPLFCPDQFLPSPKSISSVDQTVLERSTSIYYTQICPQNITTTTQTTIPALMSTHIRPPPKCCANTILSTSIATLLSLKRIPI